MKEDNTNIILKKVKILHVEDIDFNRELIELYLEDQNIELKEANNGNKALKILADFIPDLILMDIQMPELNGYETAKIIRTTENLKNIPIIALTANATTEEIKKYKHVFNAYLTKPIDEELLLETMAKYLRS